MNRTQLKTLSSNTFISGSSNTKAVDVRSYEDELIDSCLNVTDDANAEGGFLQINSGTVDVSLINSNTGVPTKKILQGDGTWRYAFSETFIADGTGAQTTFSVDTTPILPRVVVASAGGPDSAKPFYTTNYSPTGFDVVFLTAPTSGTGNVIINYYIEG
jgi:hypothetical protein